MQQTTTGWHIGSWGFWGWLETAVKGVGIIVGLLAGLQALNSGNSVVFDGNPHLAAVIWLGLICLIVVLGVPVLRITQKEIISIIFAILNALGHLGMLYSLLTIPDSRTLAIIFGVAYIAGELVKQRFLTVSGYTEAGQTTSAMINFSRLQMGIYAVFIVLVLL